MKYKEFVEEMSIARDWFWDAECEEDINDALNLKEALEIICPEHVERLNKVIAKGGFLYD